MVSKDSFGFDGVDMLQTFGVRVIARDVLLPQMRPRRITIPARDGAYDFGPGRYEDREIRLVCETRRGLSRQELRALALTLSRKARLVLWDEPDKHYLARLYDPVPLEYIGRIGHAFELAFRCDPFAIGASVTRDISGRVAYEGTAETPVRLRIRNDGTRTVSGIRLAIRRIKRT